MNERMKELVAKVETDTSGKWVSMDNVEKLVESIVRECINVVGKNTASPQAVQALIKHFVVKE